LGETGAIVADSAADRQMHRVYTSRLPDERALADLRPLLDALPRRISAVLTQPGVDLDAPAIRFQGRTIDYAELAAAVSVTGHTLRDAGVRGGDRVLVVAENCPELVALLFAVAGIDAWPVIVNARLAAREIDAIAAHCAPRSRLYLTNGSPEAAAHAERGGAHAVLRILGSEARMTAPDASSVAEPVHEDPAAQVGALIYTSGTTGTPKGVMLSHRNLLFIARLSSALRTLSARDRVYAVLPISHVYGLASVTLGTLTGGGCLDLHTRFTAQGMYEAIHAEGGVSMLQGVPSMYAKLLEFVQARGGTPRPPRLRACFSGGAPLDPALKQRFERTFGLPLNNGYGLTEAAPTIAHTRSESPRQDCAVGPLLPGVEARLVDVHHGDGRDAADGPGELWVRGPNVMLGYFRDPRATETVIRDGWLNTGDLAQCDGDGVLTIVGRTKELIIRSGFNVYPAEIEALLSAHPAVLLSAVVGRAVPGNEEVVAFVELRPAMPCDADTLAAHLRPLLAPYKQPAEIRIVAALPVAANGKVLKHQLARLASMTAQAAAAGGPVVGSSTDTPTVKSMPER
jgi:acyl-CoA synthetase (AMP-forming)/AMP-acid ligase II